MADETKLSEVDIIWRWGWFFVLYFAFILFDCQLWSGS